MSLSAVLQTTMADSGAHMGLSMRHLETGEEISIRGDESFPMCSVLKIPVLVEAFRQIQNGKFSLDDRWELTTDEKNLPSGVLVFFQDGLQPTVRDLLTLMIIISDNTATDMVIHRVGIEAVNQTMHTLGLNDIHVRLTIRQIFESLYPSADPTQDLYDLAHQQSSIDPPSDPIAYRTSPDNDVSTPRDMTRLLDLIFHGRVVNRAACDDMLEILLKQQLNDRLPRFLPPGVRCAHKTGTLSGFRNDAGIIYAGENDHIAVTVFSRWDASAVARDPEAERQRLHEIDTAFGKIGRIIYNLYAA